MCDEVELERGFKIHRRGGIWGAYAPMGSGVGYYSTEDKGHWYAAGTREAAESMVRVWITHQDTDWSDPAWDWCTPVIIRTCHYCGRTAQKQDGSWRCKSADYCQRRARKRQDDARFR